MNVLFCSNQILYQFFRKQIYAYLFIFSDSGKGGQAFFVQLQQMEIELKGKQSKMQFDRQKVIIKQIKMQAFQHFLIYIYQFYKQIGCFKNPPFLFLCLPIKQHQQLQKFALFLILKLFCIFLFVILAKSSILGLFHDPQLFNLLFIINSLLDSFIFNEKIQFLQQQIQKQMDFWCSFPYFPQLYYANAQGSDINMQFPSINFQFVPNIKNQPLQNFSYFKAKPDTKQLNQQLKHQEYNICPLVQEPLLLENGDKNPQIQNSKGSKSTRNIKANILKDFIKGLKKDASSILMAKKILGIDYEIKIFLQQLSEKLPSDGKYIRAKTMQSLCMQSHNSGFSKLLRVVFRNFLRGDYKNFILAKKKNKFQYLKAVRGLQKIVLDKKFECKDD